MYKTKKEIQTEEVEVVEDVICNKCGKPCFRLENLNQWEYATLSSHWGYGSYRDGSIERSHICHICYEEFVESFIIKDIYDERIY